MARLQMKFTVPESVAKLSNIKTVTIREISAGERQDLLAKYMDKLGEFSLALTFSAIYAINDKPVDRIEAQAAYESASAKVQDLISSAYHAVNLPTEKEKADFLDSAEAIIG